MGTSLFDRSARTNDRLTPAGKLLYSYTTRILEMRKAATISVKDLILDRGGTLRIGTHESVSLYVFPSLLQHFHEAHTTVSTELICGPSELVLTALRAGTIDLAVVADVPDDPVFERQFLLQDELVLITNPRHRLASAKSVRVRDLANEFLLLQGIKSKLRDRIVQTLKENDTPFRIAAENVAIEGIKKMVADNLGIGFVPRMCIRNEVARGSLAALRVDDIRNQWPLWLVRRKNQQLPFAAQHFFETCLVIGESLERVMVESTTEQNEIDSPSKANQRKRSRFELQKPIHC
jgi:DNA-binding transcriptional LysR family regulator